MKKSDLTENQIIEIQNKYKQNGTIAKLSKEYKVDCDVIAELVKDKSIKSRTRHSPNDPKVIDLVSKMYLDGNSQFDIYIKTGISRTTIRKILRNNNIDIRKPKDWLTIYQLNEDYFEKLDTNNKCYILGFFYADGNIGLNKRYSNGFTKKRSRNSNTNA